MITLRAPSAFSGTSAVMDIGEFARARPLG
jgi:hypothetical protein